MWAVAFGEGRGDDDMLEVVAHNSRRSSIFAQFFILSSQFSSTLIPGMYAPKVPLPGGC